MSNHSWTSLYNENVIHTSQPTMTKPSIQLTTTLYIINYVLLFDLSDKKDKFNIEYSCSYVISIYNARRHLLCEHTITMNEIHSINECKITFRRTINEISQPR